ncbi:MAG: hypothetical protein DRJ49_01540 [Thermoprotei archaeon]|nr:MAG: hypothetical protein DRN53_02010 [Thermoprotei archaeon]RLE89929.1 MAG: hypothetical protein DRJ49_01540 [Thermoprotei archaeon]
MEAKYIVRVEREERGVRIPREVMRELRKYLKPSIIRRFRNDVVMCPVKRDRVPFLLCYNCRNFVRRVMGEVHCRGEPL